MQLEAKHIASFQMLYKRQFGVEISTEQAREKGIKLLRLMQLSYKPITQEQLTQVQERQKQITKN